MNVGSHVRLSLVFIAVEMISNIQNFGYVYMCLWAGIYNSLYLESTRAPKNHIIDYSKAPFLHNSLTHQVIYILAVIMLKRKHMLIYLGHDYILAYLKQALVALHVAIYNFISGDNLASLYRPPFSLILHACENVWTLFCCLHIWKTAQHITATMPISHNYHGLIFLTIADIFVMLGLKIYIDKMGGRYAPTTIWCILILFFHMFLFYGQASSLMLFVHVFFSGHIITMPFDSILGKIAVEDEDEELARA
ncbi:hypothetical protein ACJX0J_010893, partial [Zea mays]